MDWDQIENKWAAMTRRIRADCATGQSDMKTPPSRRLSRADVPAAAITDRPAGTVVDARLKQSAE